MAQFMVLESEGSEGPAAPFRKGFFSDELAVPEGLVNPEK